MSTLAILTKCPLAKCPLAKCPLSKCHGFGETGSADETETCQAPKLKNL